MGCGCGNKNKASQTQPTAVKKEEKKKLIEIVNGKKYTYYV